VYDDRVGSVSHKGAGDYLDSPSWDGVYTETCDGRSQR
jgi:hypothetical protein